MISVCIVSSNESVEIKEVSGLIKLDVIVIKCINAENLNDVVLSTKTYVFCQPL